MNGAASSARCASGVYSALGLVVDEHRVALAERAAPRVLAGERAPACPRAAASRTRALSASAQSTRSASNSVRRFARMRASFGCGVKPAGNVDERVDDRVEAIARRRRSRPTVARGSVARARTTRPARGSLRLRLVERVFEAGAEVFERLLGLLEREVAAVHEQLGVELADRAAAADHLVHARLRERGLVALVVAVAPVADHVDDDVLLERLPELEREPDDADRRFGVVAVHVEDRRLHRLGDVGRVHRRAREAGRGREADLVVHDDVHGAADVVAGQLREVQRLRDDALARERGVAVDEHRQHVLVLGVAARGPAWRAPCLRRRGRPLRGGSGWRRA